MLSHLTRSRPRRTSDRRIPQRDPLEGPRDGLTIAVLPAHSGAGASTLALALANAADCFVDIGGSRSVHLIDAAAPPWSGLVSAVDQDVAVLNGWRRGSRGSRTVVDRLHTEVSSIDEVLAAGLPTTGGSHGVTVIDVGWSAREVLASSDACAWLRQVDLLVVVCAHAPASIRQAEHVLHRLKPDRVVVGVIGRRRADRPSGSEGTGSLDSLADTIRLPRLPSRMIGEISRRASAAPLVAGGHQLLSQAYRSSGTPRIICGHRVSGGRR